MSYPRTGQWLAVKKLNPELEDDEVDALMERAVQMERTLVLEKGLNLDQARELVNEELFPDPTETPD